VPEKGWDRPSLDFNVRPDKDVRDISRSDLLAPVGDGGLRLFGLCLACGAMISVLFVWTTLGMAAVMGLISARWVYSIVVLAAVVSTLALYAFASHDFKRWREWAEDA
jgi:hypothetical protein